MSDKDYTARSLRLVRGLDKGRPPGDRRKTRKSTTKASRRLMELVEQPLAPPAPSTHTKASLLRRLDAARPDMIPDMIRAVHARLESLTPNLLLLAVRLAEILSKHSHTGEFANIRRLELMSTLQKLHWDGNIDTDSGLRVASRKSTYELQNMTKTLLRSRQEGRDQVTNVIRGALTAEQDRRLGARGDLIRRLNAAGGVDVRSNAGLRRMINMPLSHLLSLVQDEERRRTRERAEQASRRRRMERSVGRRASNRITRPTQD